MAKTMEQLQQENDSLRASRKEYLELLARAIQNGPKDESWKTGVSYALTNAVGILK